MNATAVRSDDERTAVAIEFARNTTTGNARMIFQDATSPRYINGIGFDHLQYNLYYVIDFTASPSINKTIKRYNFDTETIY